MVGVPPIEVLEGLGPSPGPLFPPDVLDQDSDDHSKEYAGALQLP